MTTSDEYAASLYSLWSIQDTLLQSYRSMFLTAQSLVLAVSASLAASAKTPAFILAFIGLMLLLVWVRVTHSRARDVSFAQEMIKWHEAGHRVKAPLMTFKAYQAEWSRTGKFKVTFTDDTDGEFKQDGVWPPRYCKAYEVWRWNARVQFERVLPITFLLCWLAVIVYAI